MQTLELTNNKYYLTRAQFNARKLAGTLEIGAEYYITDDEFYEKPEGGIPKTDLASDVQTSLGKADSAIQSHQDISGKENVTNKVTSISSESTDTQYPSAKAVYDYHDSTKSDSSHTHDDRYYTESEIDTALAGKEDLGKLTIGGTIYQLRVSSTDAGESGYITFVV